MGSKVRGGIPQKSRVAVLAALTAAVVGAAFGQQAPGTRQAAAKIDPRVAARAQNQALVPVFIVLKNQPQAAIFEQVQAANALSLAIAQAQYLRLAQQPPADSAALAQAQADADAIVLKTRQQAFQAIEQAIQPEQDALASRLAGLGATAISRYSGVNMLSAEIPGSALAALEADPSVTEVFPVERRQAQLANSVPALGAPAYWSAGHTGQGQSVGVLDTGVRTNHPAFSGKTIVSHVFLNQGKTDSCFADDATSGEDQNGHGTHVAGIVASQGSAGWTNYQGVAKGIATLYNLKIGFNVANTAACGYGGGVAYDTDVLAGIDWAVKNTPLSVLNYSYGGDATGDDDGFTRSLDQYMDTYGLVMAIAAGNSGPGSQTVESPGIAYNSITAANWTSRGSIAGSSSRGPTNGGRYKPDLAAPGSSIYSAAFDWDTSPGTSDDFVSMSGTSMATPHLAGSAALLLSAGVPNALAVKASLINTTDNTGWASDRGWGYTNLTKTSQQPYYLTGTLAASAYKLYELTSSGAFSATVTWNRHPSGSTSNFNHIYLYLFPAGSASMLNSSTASIQNVQQVAATYNGNVIVTVQMASSSLSGVSSEPFALALSTAGATAMNGPSLSPSCTLPASISTGSQFTMSCTAANSGDLTAFGVAGQATLPSGFSGGTQMSLGDVAAAHTSSSGNLTLTAPDTAGTYQIPFAVTTNSYAEVFSGSANYTANVVTGLPAPVLTSPANGATGVSQTPTLTWNASSGATSYDVYFGNSTPPPLATNTTSTTYSPATLSAGTVYYWRVVAKNAGGSSSSATWSFTTVTPAPAAPVLGSPANGATGVSTTTALTWQASTGATSYDVYFGTSSSPPLATNITGTYWYPGTLSQTTLYYWKVVAKNSAGSASSAIWSFTTQSSGPTGPVVLLSPANGATGVSTTPALTWQATSGATSYDVYFGTASSPALAVNTTSTSYSPGTLSAGTVYYWYVVAKNSGGSVSSAHWSFTTYYSGPPAPVLVSPLSGATGVSTTVTLVWNASNGATSYDVYFGPSSPPPLAVNTTATTYTPPTLNPGTAYQWYVVAKNANGSSSSAIWTFFTQVPLPAAPVLMAPANGATGVSTSPTLSWNAATGATGYYVYLGVSPSPPAQCATSITSCVPSTALQSGTLYYWRVEASNSAGSVTSPTWSFTTQVPAPAVPILSAPAHGAAGVSLTPTLSWNPANWATSYDVYFGTSASQPKVGTTTGTTYSPGPLSPGTQYFWNIVAKNAVGSTDSDMWSFTTQVAPPAAPVLAAPADGASGVSTTPTLSWNAAAGALSYDVYFGNSSPPPLVANVTSTAYAPGSLAVGGVYLWRVVAKNAGGSNSSTTWSFTAGIGAPGLLSPGNGAVGVSLSPTLTWSAATGATSYDVYFGTQASPPLVTNTTATSYATGNLAASSLYFWRVVAKNGAGSLSSPAWSFSTPVSQQPAVALRFVPVTPCRIADTRADDGAFGGPLMAAGEQRSIPVPQSACNIPATAQAYSLNVTVVPQGRLGYLTLWPTGQGQPLVSTLNSFDGNVVANAAIVPAGAGGGVNVFVTDPTDVILDIDGYFDTAGGSNSYSFYPTTPCRIADTRNPAGPLGGPSMTTGQSRDFAVPSSACGLPPSARAYSLNVTAVPDPRVRYLGYLSTWPTGQAQPLVSTLNSWTGKVVANAALVPAGAGGAVSVFVTDPTDVILDTNGYFGSAGGAGALSFYPVAPCRIADTRNAAGPLGGPEMEAGTSRSFPIPSSACGIPAGAAAYSLNVTVVPEGMLGYLTTWPAGQAQPLVSTLNSWDGSVVANAAIVPAGTGGAVSVFVTDRTHVVLDINGYFAP